MSQTNPHFLVHFQGRGRASEKKQTLEHIDKCEWCLSIPYREQQPRSLYILKHDSLFLL